MYYGSEKIGSVYFGGEKIAEGWMVDQGVLRRVFEDGKWVRVNTHNTDDAWYAVIDRMDPYGVKPENASVLPTGVDFTGSTDTSAAFYMWELLTKVRIKGTSTSERMGEMFFGNRVLTELIGLDTSSLVDAETMFQGAYAIETIPPLDLSKLRNAKHMFSECSSLKHFSGVWNTPVLEVTEDMFSNCSSLEYPPLMDTSKVINAKGMFYNSQQVKVIPAYDLSSAANMEYLLLGAYALTEINMFGMRYSFSIENAKLNASELNALFGRLGSAAGEQNLKITGNPGAAACNPAIATAKGWTVER